MCYDKNYRARKYHFLINNKRRTADKFAYRKIFTLLPEFEARLHQFLYWTLQEW